MDPGTQSAASERRYATVMFADITGFTAMCERTDPEEVYPIITGCLKLLDGIARAHGGNVDKHIGDCVMVVFGVPVAIEDAAKAAVNAAIEMRDRVYEYNRELGLVVPLDIHTGINSGLVISGEMSEPASRELMLMGDVVNTASRLKELAPPGAIYVGAQKADESQVH